jgi:hypothetical protein
VSDTTAADGCTGAGSIKKFRAKSPVLAAKYLKPQLKNNNNGKRDL